MNSKGKQLGPYTLISRLGNGAFGEVWLAEWRTNIVATKVAIKLPLDSEADIDLIKQEARLWVQASGHPNVLPIIEANTYGDQLVIVSEYAADGSLSQWLAKCRGLAPSVEMAIEMVDGILAGLQHLHERRIVHRDLKPPNILLQGDIPRLTDFGLSRVLSSGRSGTIAGTPQYMAPEAFDGERNERTDIWSVGVILYQLLSGELPFPQQDATSLMGALFHQEPAPLPDLVPIALRAVITRSLARNPARRYMSAAEMKMDLRTAARTISRGAADQPTIRNEATQKPVVPQSPAVIVALQPPAEESATNNVTSKTGEFLKGVLAIFGGGIAETRPQKTIRKWRLLSRWTGDYKSQPSAWAFNGELLTSFYGPFSSYDGPRPFRFEEDEDKDEESSRVYLWHLPTGALMGSFAIEKGTPEELFAPVTGAFSPDGETFACSQKRGVVGLWSPQTGRIVRDFDLASGLGLFAMTFSPDGHTLACSCYDETMRIWELRSSSVQQVFPTHSKSIGTLIFSPNGRMLAGVSSSHEGLRVWNSSDGMLRFSSMVGKTFGQHSVAFSPDSRLLAAVSYDRKVVIWDTSDGKIRRVLDNTEFDGSFVTFSPDGQTLACCRWKQEQNGQIGRELGLGLFDARTGEMKALLDEDKDICGSAFSSDGRMLVNWCADKAISLWEAE